MKSLVWILALSLFLTACSTPDRPKSADREGTAMSLVEQRLQRIVERQDAFFAEAEAGLLGEATFTRRAAAIASEYDGLVATAPSHVLTLVLYGKFLRRVGARDDAQLMFARANTLDPELAVVKQQIGNYMAEEGQHGAALALYLAAVELEPEEAAYHYSLGELLAHFRDQFVADEAFTEQSVENEMLKAFRRAAELDPENLDFALRHAEAYYDLYEPRWEEALGVWNALASGELGTFEAQAVRLHRARVLIELLRFEEARSLLDEPVAAPLEQNRQELLAQISEE